MPWNRSFGFYSVMVWLVSLAYCFVGTVNAQAPSAFAVTWSAPLLMSDGTKIATPITYQVYLGPTGQEKVFGTPVSAPPYVIKPTPTPGVATCVQVTAIVGGVESARTPEACATVPLPPPNPPTSVTVTIK
jgi:hypothetical protein